ncbi:RING/U-box [Glarea lozoyensis ATCC 20868]|uniref:RBR-type E3 ubiquitin transferase n=1 Tax=Glarea lozoyensis (strain ATCC 20868 / MF5171) TaxID=1116229 RepID=S3CXV9_GLAL2|nr:RING/U-box [Glarea lozoyensis ATCC 20868]EPE24671.1 RING/U-box [Glarea lozoyensis ATCC 20868]
MAVQRIVPAFQGIDDATAALILQLLLQDSEELAASGAKGKDRAGTSASDSELAVLLYQQELKKSEQFVNDRQVAAHLDPLGTITYNGLEQARRIKAARIPVTANAIVRALITTVAKEENDKGPSLTFSSTIAKAAASCPSPEKLSSNASSSGSSTQSDDTFKTSKTSIVSQSNSNSVKNAEINQQVAESSAWAASRNTSNKGKEKVTRCCVCYEDIPTYDVVDLSCEDHYCRDCLQQLFSHSFKDLTLFPPRCCKNELTPEIVGLLLTSDLIREFEERKLEYDTTDKIYCANSTCSAFLKKEHIDTTSNAAFCPACWTETCTLCKSPAHEGLCPEDETTKMILALAEKNHWKQCSSCKAMVEISFGCNHMRYPPLPLLLPLQLPTFPLTSPDVAAAPNGATRAALPGNTANARSGPKTTFSSARPPLRIAKPLCQESVGTSRLMRSRRI